MQKQVFPLSVSVMMILTVFSSSFASAVSEPTVIEELIVYEFGDTHASYTVVNPVDSNIGDIVGFVIEVDYNWYLEAFTANGWLAQGSNSLTFKRNYLGAEYVG